jgi:hypothetical protein
MRMINPTIATTITMTTTFGSLKLWLPTTSPAAILRCAVASASTGRVSLPGPPSIQPMQNPSAKITDHAPQGGQGRNLDYYLSVGRLRLKRIPNSVDTLAPTNRFVLAINTIPIAPGIPYHTIMGDRGKGDAPNSSDGVVPHWSSHMDGAKSELIVSSGHGAHQNPKAIVEVRRILILNVGLANRGKTPAKDPSDSQ